MLVKVNAPDTTFTEGGQEIVLAYNTETRKYEWVREVKIKPRISLLPIVGLAIIIIMIVAVIIYALYRL